MVVKSLAYKILNAPLRSYPYPHIYVPDVFPAELYAELQRQIPDPAAMVPMEQVRKSPGYRERFVQDLRGPLEGLTDAQRAFWKGMGETLLGGEFRDVMLTRFRTFVRERFKGQGEIRLYDESVLVQDITNYALGPHTDAPGKVITVLFYLPKDDSQAHIGTSLYLPQDPERRCPGGPHYGYEGFERVATMPFLPNAMFAFVKSDVSFHGVEPVTDPDVRRWLLGYDIKARISASAQGAG